MRDVVNDARRAGRHVAGPVAGGRAAIAERIVVGPHRAMLRPHHRGLQQVALDTDVEELGLRALMGLADCDLLRRNDAADMALRIVEVAGHDRLRGTNDDAGRFEIGLDAMRAEVAFGGRAGFGVNVKRVVGAGLHAGLASDTAAVVEINDAVVALEQRAGRANLDARRLLAMVASHHAEMAAGVGEGTLLDVLDPGAKDADRDLVLILAGNRAGVTSDASVLVDHEAVTHPRISPHSSSTQGRAQIETASRPRDFRLRTSAWREAAVAPLLHEP